MLDDEKTLNPNFYATLGLILNSSLAGGFCENQGGKHTIEYILLFQNKDYLTISPGFSSGGEAESCSRTETSLNLSAETGSQYYSAGLVAFASGKKSKLATVSHVFLIDITGL